MQERCAAGYFVCKLEKDGCNGNWWLRHSDHDAIEFQIVGSRTKTDSKIQSCTRGELNTIRFHGNLF